jgi:uncharacterized SAM-binding protein YcdF (DUF218 family)
MSKSVDERLDTFTTADLDFTKLSDEDKMDIVLHSVSDYSEGGMAEGKEVDAIIVLGASPKAILPRMKKFFDLVRAGYSKTAVFSGGLGWVSLYEKRPKTKQGRKKKEYIQIIRGIIIDDRVLGPKDGEGLSREMMGRRFQMLGEITESEVMKHMTEKEGIFSQIQILEESKSKTTPENASKSAEVLEKAVEEGKISQPKKVIVVTSLSHCTRARLSFLKDFSKDIEVVMCPAPTIIGDKPLEMNDPELRKDKHFQKNVAGECWRIVKYSGGLIPYKPRRFIYAPGEKEEKYEDREVPSIQVVPLKDLVGEDIARRIIARHIEAEHEKRPSVDADRD